jgi:hypothetical protein
MLCLLLTTQVTAFEYRALRSFDIAAEPACMPCVTRAANGDVLVAFSTEWEPFPAGGIAKLTVSQDGGATWSEPRNVWKHDNPGVTIQVGNGIQTLSNGDILLPLSPCLWPKAKDADPNEIRPHLVYDMNAVKSRPEYWRITWLARSRDNGNTWSLSKLDFYNNFQFGRIWETGNGQLILPGYGWFVESSDLGHSWGPQIWLTDNEKYRNETNVVEADDGTLIALVRGGGGHDPNAVDPPRRAFGIQYSQDGGQSWTPPKFAGIQGKMPDLLVLPSGRILMVVGAEGLSDGSEIWRQTDRFSFCTLFYSDDHGQTWHRDLPLAQVQPGSSVVPSDSPGLCQLDDGRILVVCQAADRSKAGHSLFGYHLGMSVMGNIIEPHP